MPHESQQHTQRRPRGDEAPQPGKARTPAVDAAVEQRAPRAAAPTSRRARTSSADARATKTQKRSATLTVKMQPAKLRLVENAIDEVQAMATTEQPDKSVVIAWMLTSVKPKDLKKKMDQWNDLFD